MITVSKQLNNVSTSIDVKPVDNGRINRIYYTTYDRLSTIRILKTQLNDHSK